MTQNMPPTEQLADDARRAITVLSRAPETKAGMSLVEAVDAVYAAYIAAQLVVNRARRLIVEWDDRSALIVNLGPLRVAIEAYDQTVGPAIAENEQKANES